MFSQRTSTLNQKQVGHLEVDHLAGACCHPMWLVGVKQGEDHGSVKSL